MSDDKYCETCGKYLGNVNEMDLYKFIRMKYCPDCAALNKKIKDRNRAKEVRQSIKEKNKQVRMELEELKEKNRILELEIDILRKKLIEYREMLD